MSEIDDLASRFLSRALMPEGAEHYADAKASLEQHLQTISEHVQGDPQSPLHWLALLSFGRPDHRDQVMLRLESGTLAEDSRHSLVRLDEIWLKVTGMSLMQFVEAHRNKSS